MTELPILLLDNFFLFPKCENYLRSKDFYYIILGYNICSNDKSSSKELLKIVFL